MPSPYLKLTHRITQKEFFHLWDNGLGTPFCQNNPGDDNVLTIQHSAQRYFSDGIIKAIVSAGSAIIAIYAFYYLFTHPEISASIRKVYLIPTAFVAWAGQFAVQAFRFLDSSQKLKRNDLSGFELEDYEPAIDRLKRTSIIWGIENNTLEYSGGNNVRLLRNVPKESSDSSYVRLAAIFVVVGMFVIATPIMSIIGYNISVTKAYRAQGIYRLKDTYSVRKILYDKKTKSPVTGTFQSLYRSGEIFSECSYLKGQPVGIEKKYYPTGKLMAEYFYEHGKKNGVAKKYYHSGELSGEVPYKDGVLNGPGKSFHSSGEVSRKFTLVQGLIQGISYGYYQSGEISSCMQYKDDKVEGAAYQYYISGKLKKITHYKNGTALSGYEYDEEGSRKELTPSDLKWINS